MLIYFQTDIPSLKNNPYLSFYKININLQVISASCLQSRIRKQSCKQVVNKQTYVLFHNLAFDAQIWAKLLPFFICLATEIMASLC